MDREDEGRGGVIDSPPATTAGSAPASTSAALVPQFVCGLFLSAADGDTEKLSVGDSRSVCLFGVFSSYRYLSSRNGGRTHSLHHQLRRLKQVV